MPSVDYDPRRDADTDLFALLGTEWAADPAVVRRAWRTASQTAHPDAGGSHDAFIRMQHAWEVLADATRRTRYVRAYEARHGPQRRHEPDRRPPCTPRDRGRTAPPPPGPTRLSADPATRSSAIGGRTGSPTLGRRTDCCGGRAQAIRSPVT